MRLLGELLAGIVAGAGEHQRRGALRLLVVHVGHERRADRASDQDGAFARRRIVDRFPAGLRHVVHGQAGLGPWASGHNPECRWRCSGTRSTGAPSGRSSRTGPSDWDARRRSPARFGPSARSTTVLRCDRPCASWSPSLFIERQISEDRPSDLFCQHVRSNFFEQAQERDGRLRATAQIAGAPRGSPRRR